MEMPPSEFIIYDYASFTSRLVDFKQFVQELAEFCMDTQVTLFDTHIGIRKENLGRLLHIYNETCNKDGEFSVHRIFGIGPFDDGVIVSHKVAGMLGVYGNIVGSTALHGITAINICGSEDQTNTIGDDAGMTYDATVISFEDIKRAIRTIGDIAEDKFERWTLGQEMVERHDGWHYTKRPIVVENGSVFVGWLPEFPVLARILGIKDGQHTIPHETLQERRRLMIKQTGRFLNSMTTHQSQLTEQDIAISLDILRKAYHQVHLDPKGAYPQRYTRSVGHSYPDELLATPPLTEEAISEGWWVALRLNEPDAIISIPIDYGQTDIPRAWTVGTEFVSTGSKLFGLMEKIKVLEKEPMREDVLVDDEVLERYEDFLMNRRRPVYLYRVLKDYEQYQSFTELLDTDHDAP
jgi:hypothetical protein